MCKIKIIKMFNFFRTNNKKEARAPVDLNKESQNKSNRMNDLGLKIDQVKKQLKAKHQIYRTTCNPIIKEEEKCMRNIVIIYQVLK